MRVRIVVLATVFLTLASMSHAQAVRASFSADQSHACRSVDSDRAKKQEELLRVQTRISNLMAAMVVLREGQARQQEIAALGKLQAAMGGTAGVAKVTKAMSDTFLDITQAAAPHVKKAYDAFDAFIAMGVSAYEGNVARTAGSGFEGVQNAGDAYSEYMKRQKGMVVRPGNTQTPGVMSSAWKGTDDLSRGDFAGATSNFAAGVDKLTESTAKKTKLALRAGSKLAAGVAETPGKTDDSRFADGLSASSEFGKLVARAAQEREAFGIASMAGRTGRVLGHSGMMLEQVSKTKEGLAEAVDMYGEYKAIDERAASTVRNLERQIQEKYKEVTRLHAQGLKIQDEMRRAESKVRACLDSEALRLAKANQPNRSARAPAAAANNSYKGLKTRPWDRQASQQRLNRAMQLRRAAEARAVQYSPPSFTLGPANKAGAPKPEPRPTPSPAWHDSICSDVACQ